jgi:UDP-N-acetylglucosamine acyltransferase
MANHIDPRAVVHATAEIADGVTIGPYAIIGESVQIGVDTTIGPHAVLERWITIGARCRIGANAVLGGDPQYLDYAGERSYLEIGDDNDIRELTVIQRSAKAEGATRIGAHNLIMAQAHVAHDCVIGDHTVIASLTGLAGHVEIEDWATVGGVTGIHQFVRVGAYSMVGGGSRLSQDAPPYMTVNGNPATVRGLNMVGLRRNGFGLELRRELKTAYRLLYRSGLNVSQALDKLKLQAAHSGPVTHLVQFIECSKRGICSKAGASLLEVDE